jgi:hypothetical protein
MKTRTAVPGERIDPVEGVQSERDLVELAEATMRQVADRLLTGASGCRPWTKAEAARVLRRDADRLTKLLDCAQRGRWTGETESPTPPLAPGSADYDRLAERRYESWLESLKDFGP